MLSMAIRAVEFSRGYKIRNIELEIWKGGTYPLAHFLGNFREKTKKVPTRTVSRKLPEISLKVPKKLRALLPLAHFRKGNFSDSRKFLKSPVTTRTLWIWNSCFDITTWHSKPFLVYNNEPLYLRNSEKSYFIEKLRDNQKVPYDQEHDEYLFISCNVKRLALVKAQSSTLQSNERVLVF